jgi:hypothetical protein
VVFYLLVLALLPAAITLFRSRQLTHVAFFSAGYLFYWVLPILLGQVQIFDADEGFFGNWVVFFKRVPQGQLEIYAVSILVYYFCFILGDRLARKTKPSFPKMKSPPLTFVSVLYIIVFIVAASYTYYLRSLIGANYDDIGEGILSMGTLVAFSLTLLGMALLKTTESEKATFFSTISNRWMLGFFLISFLQLTMGGRLYFVSSLLLMAGYRSVFFRKYSGGQLLAFVLGAAVFGGAAGLLRLRSGVNTLALVLNLAGEPVGTSFSLVSFLSSNHIPWIEFPRFLAGDLLNLVPRVIFENKMDFLPDPTKAGFSFVSPQGAMNSWVSFIINFGLAGTAIVMVLIGFCLRWLLMNATSPILKTQYLMCSAFLTFTFFRDAFSMSLVKNIFEFSIVMPLVCAQLSGWLVWSAGGRSELIGQTTLASHPNLGENPSR